MHMADALISPAVGGALWVLSGGWIAYCARKVKKSLRDDLAARCGVPLRELSMGMTGDFALAVAAGSTLVRVGSALFGAR